MAVRLGTVRVRTDAPVGQVPGQNIPERKGVALARGRDHAAELRPDLRSLGRLRARTRL